MKTTLTNGIGMVKLPSGKSFQFGFGEKVEPTMLDSFSPEQRVGSLDERKLRDFVGTVRRFNEAEGLKPDEKRMGMEAAMHRYLGQKWEVGSRCLGTGDRYDYIAFFLMGSEESPRRAYQVFVVSDNGTTIHTNIPCEGGALEHTVRANPTGGLLDTSCAFLAPEPRKRVEYQSNFGGGVA